VVSRAWLRSAPRRGDCWPLLPAHHGELADTADAFVPEQQAQRGEDIRLIIGCKRRAAA
jgi:hypothetical protein